jgi:hypothetical protein
LFHIDTTPSTSTMGTSEPSTETTRKDEKSIQCGTCQKRFNRTAELRRHNDTFHNPNASQYFCTVPGCDRVSRSFHRKDKYEDHMRKVHARPSASGTYEHDEEASQAMYSCDHEGYE